MTESLDRIVLQAMRQSRDSALDAAAELCDAFAATGHDAACCAKAIRDMKRMLADVAPRPDGMN